MAINDKPETITVGNEGSWVHIPPSRQGKGFYRSTACGAGRCIGLDRLFIAHAARRTLYSRSSEVDLCLECLTSLDPSGRSPRVLPVQDSLTARLFGTKRLPLRGWRP